MKMSVITMVLIFGGAAVFLLLLVGMVITMTSERSLVEQRLGRYIQDNAEVAAKKGERTSLVGDWLNVRLEKWVGHRANWRADQAKNWRIPGDHHTGVPQALVWSGWKASLLCDWGNCRYIHPPCTDGRGGPLYHFNDQLGICSI
jgi:hypothetical protein